MSIRERLDSLSRGELTGLVIVVVATLLGAGFWYMRSLPRPVDIAAPADAVSPVVSPVAGRTGRLRRAPRRSSSTSPDGCARPGVYEFASGDRVIDAVNRAGGARNGADLTSLNLAAPLADGTQIVVPKPGATAPGSSGRPRPARRRRDDAHQHQHRERDRARGPARRRSGDRGGHHRLPDAERAVLRRGRPDRRERHRSFDPRTDPALRDGMNAWALPAAAAAFWAGLLAWEVHPPWARPWMGMALGLAGLAGAWLAAPRTDDGPRSAARDRAGRAAAAASVSAVAASRAVGGSPLSRSRSRWSVWCCSAPDGRASTLRGSTVRCSLGSRHDASRSSARSTPIPRPARSDGTPRSTSRGWSGPAAPPRCALPCG